MRRPEILVRLPEWAEAFAAERRAPLRRVEDRVGLAVELSRRNVEEGTGGPFGAAVFERDGGRLLAVGVNLVEPCNCSVAHAEVVAIVLAQQARGHWDLGAEGPSPCDLATSTEPCAMCLGAVHWSGVSRLLCAARDEDARAVGFDEGLKPPGWVEAFERRGLAVVRDVLRDEARAVLADYARRGGSVYNPRPAT